MATAVADPVVETEEMPATVLCTCTLIGVAPISFSAPVQSVIRKKEQHDMFEERTWRERVHANSDGFIFIPPMALKNCLSECAKFFGEKVPGRGNETFTKHFVSGILVIQPMIIEPHVTRSDVRGERLFVPSNGQRGGGKRVWKKFPYIQEWKVEADIHVIDHTLISNIGKVREYTELAGQFVGMGRFRPINNGYYGRWRVEDWVQH